MLTIDLRRLKEAGVRIEGVVAAEDALWTGADVEFLCPFWVDVTAHSTGEHSVMVRGRMGARVRGYCRRCLTPLDLEIDDAVDLFFEPLERPDDEDLNVYHVSPLATDLDLGKPLREQFLLAIPSFPLCREECRGLCAGCGADLNVEPCRCLERAGDPRWAPLRALDDRS
ncbi:MAG: DUF177 domain-containing protein [Gemmatimonadetes bacterium]|nr:DUF177 domain-containing protein [Gemmatimonadota bacterium]